MTNGNFRKTENAVTVTNVPFLPLKLTANWKFYFVNGWNWPLTKWLEKVGTCPVLVPVESLRCGLVKRINFNKDEKFRFSGINIAS